MADRILTFDDFAQTHHKSEHGWGEIDERDGYLENCPFCAIKAQPLCKLVLDIPYEKYVDYLAELNVRMCPVCGWWQSDFWQVDGVMASRSSDVYVRSSLLKSYSDVDSASVAVSELRTYIRRKGDAIYSVHPTNMEKLVGSVFEDFFSCEVRHCGRSHDGGVDLYLVQGDTEIPIQVKRRTTPEKAEPVDTIRNLMGVMFRDHCTKGMVVTTSRRFSDMAQREVAKVLRDGTCEQFDLVDVDRFFAMIRAVASHEQPPGWVTPPEAYISREKLNEVWCQYLDRSECVTMRYSYS